MDEWMDKWHLNDLFCTRIRHTCSLFTILCSACTWSASTDFCAQSLLLSVLHCVSKNGPTL